MITAKFNMDFELISDPIRTSQVLQETSRDFDSVRFDILKECTMVAFECGHAVSDYEKQALDAYTEAFEDMEAIHSNLNIIREASERTVWEKIKAFIKVIIEKLKMLWARFTLWISTFIKSNKKMIEKYSNVDGAVTFSSYNLDKAFKTLKALKFDGDVKSEKDLENLPSNAFLGLPEFDSNITLGENMLNIRKAILGEKQERTYKVSKLVDFLKYYEKHYSDLNRLGISVKVYIEKLKNLFRDSESAEAQTSKMVIKVVEFVTACWNELINVSRLFVIDVRNGLSKVQVEKNSYEPEVATEGWAMLIPFLNIPLTVIGINNVDKIVHNPKVEKYIESQCKEILAEEKKRDKSITKDMPPGLINAMARNIEGNQSLTFKSSLKNVGVHTRVKGFYCVPYGDTDHLEGVSVVLYSENRDKFIARRIAAPKKQELKDIGFKEED